MNPGAGGAADAAAGGGLPVDAAAGVGAAAAAGGGLLFDSVHHIGITVADLDRAIGFWERLIGSPSRNRRLLDGPQLGTMVGYPGIRIDSCWLDLPGGVALELLQYLDRDDDPYHPGTAHPGNVHICLLVGDMTTMHAHAVACGARPVSEAPIVVTAGPRAGSRLAYLRDPDGVTIELLQPPPAAPAPPPAATPGAGACAGPGAVRAPARPLRRPEGTLEFRPPPPAP